MDNQKKRAFQFIILLGIVSLFGDMAYEGARGATGPFLAFLGASAAIVGLIAGAGEFLGYALRLVSGYFTDRTRAYWPATFIGYGLILAVPLLAFTDYWQLAAVFIILERMGKGIRTPARDTILSHATKQVGRGLGFGIHEAVDQVGGVIGPLIFTAAFLLRGGYSDGFTLLWIPALLTLAILVVARLKVPSPEKLETSEPTVSKDKPKLSKVFWLYTLFAFLAVAGFANFQIISYHFTTQSVVPEAQIFIFYAIVMGVDGLVAILIGKTYDKIGLISLITIPLLTLPIPFLALSNIYSLAAISAVLIGAVFGIHETIMRAGIADLTPLERRGFAYGFFNTAYGASFFIGSAVIGFLYDLSIEYLILFVVVMELASLPVFLLIRNVRKITE